MNRLQKIFSPELEWENKSIIAADPCPKCPTHIEYMEQAIFGSVADRQYARLPDTCPCMKRLQWLGDALAKLEWYERNDPRLKKEEQG